MTTFAIERIAEERLATLRDEADRYRARPQRWDVATGIAKLRGLHGLVEGAREPRPTTSGTAVCCA